ncbi:MAG: UDP-3-O-(3-hydroxymyristoyl)glucosamine N-acyltransferase [Candidatus Gastranaerophilales bacterium]|nr:UDP-3-O-(3-hydroxymyristoyl)glucosamine N-acyltransferase [Candidatus Gastranaerophilales bacterium]
MDRKYTINQIQEIVGGILSGDGSIEIKKLLPPKLADENTLALALSEEEIENLTITRAKAAMVPIGVSLDHITTIEVERPRLAMMKLLHLFYEAPDAPTGIHPTAVVHPDAKLGQNVSIGPGAVIGREAQIGDNAKILANVYIGKKTQIGHNCLFYPNVCIGDFVSIGNNVIIHHGASIGADGFSFVTENPSNVEIAKEQGQIEEKQEQKIYKIPSIGSVEIKDDVEIGANATIDRGTIENTIIGKGTKIDNLVMIAHNCNIGEGCLVISQVGIAGSCKVGDRVVLAGQVGLADHINIGSDSIVMAQAGVSKSFPEKSIIMGYPAVPRREFVKQTKNIKSVENLLKEVKILKEELEELKKIRK